MRDKLKSDRDLTKKIILFGIRYYSETGVHYIMHLRNFFKILQLDISSWVLKVLLNKIVNSLL